MKLKLKEDPKEWRKNAWLMALGLAILSSLLRWRHILPVNFWIGLLVLAAGMFLGAAISPRTFRGLYRISVTLGFYLSQFVGQIVLTLVFLLILTPMGLLMRLMGKDLLRLKRSREVASYWNERMEKRPLDRLF